MNTSQVKQSPKRKFRTNFFNATFSSSFLFLYEKPEFLSRRAIEIIHIRYPSNPQIVFKHPHTKQPNGTACGVFACANATSLLLGRDPSRYPLLLQHENKGDETMALREHFATMLMKNELTLFPTTQ